MGSTALNIAGERLKLYIAYTLKIRYVVVSFCLKYNILLYCTFERQYLFLNIKQK